VVFVAHSFTTHQQQAINFRDLPIELWEVSLYDNNTVLFNQLKASKSSESIKTISKNSTIQKVNSEVKVFSADDHFTGPKESSRELYELLRDKLKTLDSRLQENPRKSYIGYALGENGLNTLVYVHPQTNGLRFDIPGIYPKNVTDPLSKVVYQEKSLERFNTPLSIMYAINEADVDYAISILKMALQYRFSN
jgi:predicted transport protein